MKLDAKKIQKSQQEASVIYNQFQSIKDDLFLLIKPHVYNDMEIEQGDICVDCFSGDGFAFMIGDRGVSVNEMIDRISELKKDEKIKLSDLTTYL
ncbi:hypothetical protein CLV62_12534 [Dysgonomonas alginatilytica]|uniref:Uncharacterized protein n=1 Tax=Dysgonomonas alginatilytica TaxID=1605892 RepID=A0A2V3PKY8_9BACT|nr:hypothetical protein [Dysgonomonas alginatilytica]PXV61201.1 hypothetical protein CLV62_12534 [Dysgonomonas alginatilytica]